MIYGMTALKKRIHTTYQSLQQTCSSQTFTAIATEKRLDPWYVIIHIVQ